MRVRQADAPREDNAKADALANLGSLFTIPSETRIPIIHILILAIEDPTKKLKDSHNLKKTTKISTIKDPDPMAQHQDPNIQDPSSTSGSWIHPIMEYL